MFSDRYREIRKEFKELRLQYSQLSTIEKEGTVGVAIYSRIEAIRAEMREIMEATPRYHGPGGNYKDNFNPQ